MVLCAAWYFFIGPGDVGPDHLQCVLMISKVLPGYVRDVTPDPRSSPFPFQYQKMRDLIIFCMLQYMIFVVNEDPGVWAVNSDIT